MQLPINRILVGVEQASLSDLRQLDKGTPSDRIRPNLQDGRKSLAKPG